MKSISYHQPYAWMIANGHLDIDDRTWETNHRGELAIHASKTFSKPCYDYVKYHLNIDIPEPEYLEFGGFVAIVNLVGCVRPGEPTNVPHHRRAHGGGHCFGWQVDQVRKLDFIPWRGQQGLFEVDMDELLRIPAADLKPKQDRLF